ncbi:rod shape-determining protein RodA [Thiohalomonas denitrificans]|uniref:rod shape-determining protein RodA n=1 Tax=Thiohalomonas denitrificans TaxID=415747 RepID=UPI0026EC0976|nr:rod shape-determining protein RodA [Thiohalomonas denitrificans]
MILDAPTSLRGSLANRLHLDLPLLIALLLLSGVSLAVLYSADSSRVDQQLLRLAVGFVVMLVLAQIPPDNYIRWTPWLYALAVGLLIAVLLAGIAGKGAQRWIGIGGFRFQPSELMKLAMPMMVAWYLREVSLPPSLKKLFAAVLIVAIPTLLIAKQPDLGTAVLVAGAGIFVLLFSGIPFKVLGFASLLLAPLAGMLWKFGMHDYQRQRVLTFLTPESDPLGAGYHIIQSKIAIGSGGLYGKGWLNGTQSHLEFLPERHTDFIFAVFGEEFGLLGGTLLLSVYLFIVWRGLYIAAQAQEPYGRLLIGGLIMTFFIYFFINIGMVAGLLPVVGLPLPLVSFGGTSMVTIMASFGILMSIHTHRKLLKG